MPEVLAPCLELLWSLAKVLAKSGKCLSEAVRMEVLQVRVGEGFAEDRPNWRRIAPVLPVKAGDFKLAARPQRNARCGGSSALCCGLDG